MSYQVTSLAKPFGTENLELFLLLLPFYNIPKKQSPQLKSVKSQLRPNGSRRIHAFHLSSLEVLWRCKTPRGHRCLNSAKVATPRCTPPIGLSETLIHRAPHIMRFMTSPKRTRKHRHTHIHTHTLIQHGEGRVALHYWKTWHICIIIYITYIINVYIYDILMVHDGSPCGWVLRFP